MNYSAENVSKCLASSNYTFNNYCDEYNIPKTGTIYISGVTTSYYDLIIDANEYWNKRKNITVNPTTERSIDYHWTIKIENNNISEIWTCKTQLSQAQLKSYNYNEQVDMIPLLKKDKFDYAIGYYKTSDWQQLLQHLILAFFQGSEINSFKSEKIYSFSPLFATYCY